MVWRQKKVGVAKNRLSLDNASDNGLSGSPHEIGSKISAQKNPRVCEGFCVGLLWKTESVYFLRRHLATAPPSPSSPNTATEVGSGTAPPPASSD